jgi:hypothetical protein
LNETQSHVVECVRRGMTIEEAAQEAGRPIGTVRRWLTNGRNNPDGPYGPFARATAAARVPVPEAFAGERLAEVEAVGAHLGTDDVAVRAKLGLARGLARKLDWCEKTHTGAAAMAMANLSKQYAAVLDEINTANEDDKSWLLQIFASDPDETQEQIGRYEAALGEIARARSDGSPDYMDPAHTADEAREIARTALRGED